MITLALGKLRFDTSTNSQCVILFSDREIDKGCLQPSFYDDSIFGEYIGSLVKKDSR